MTQNSLRNLRLNRSSFYRADANPPPFFGKSALLNLNVFISEYAHYLEFFWIKLLVI